MQLIKNIKAAEKEILNLGRRSRVSPDAEKTVRKIIDDVRKNGDKALLYYSRKFERVPPKNLVCKPAELKQAWQDIEDPVKKLLRRVEKNIRRFHACQIRKSWRKNFGYGILGENITPISSVGVYVPGGRAPLVSTVLMTVIPAQAAGVERIAVMTPPDQTGRVNKYILAALYMLGVSEVYCGGGAQAIAALAYGTKTIPAVDKIAGPGNLYVTLAKKAVYGDVGIDMLAGPSEVVVVAGAGARADWIALDLLAQAEHDPETSCIFITPSGTLARKVVTEIGCHIRRLGFTRDNAEKSLAQWGKIIAIKSFDEAARLVNLIAPEHLELIDCPKSMSSKIKNAGAIFVGEYTPVVLGDYVIGPSHVLPTERTARFSSGLSVDTFQKKSSFIHVQKINKSLLIDAANFALLEGLEAHSLTSKHRMC